MMPIRYRIRTPRPQPQAGGRYLAQPGRGEEFYDHRPYAPVDDPRWIDWKASARTGRPIVRRFEEARMGRFFLWIDGSKSMELFGKATYAEEIARVLLAAARGERIRILTDAGPRPAKEPIPKDPRGLFAARPRGNGVQILITDGLEEGDYPALFRRAAPLHLILILSGEELSPRFESALLKDVETGEALPVDRGRIPAYQRALREHLAKIERAARRHGTFTLLKVKSPVIPGLYSSGVLELR